MPKPNNMEAKLLGTVEGMRGDARYYRLSHPLEGNEVVVVSAVNNAFAHETYIFPGNEEGKVTGWSELSGSAKDTTSHEEVLGSIGYSIVS